MEGVTAKKKEGRREEEEKVGAHQIYGNVEREKMNAQGCWMPTLKKKGPWA